MGKLVVALISVALVGCSASEPPPVALPTAPSVPSETKFDVVKKQPAASAVPQPPALPNLVRTELEQPLVPEIRPTFREWISLDGAFRRLAVFSAFQGGRLSLKLESGAEITVPLGKVSQGDREYVKELLRTDSAASVIFCKVVDITDGDTIVVLDDQLQQHKIRLEGIDAPESRQNFGTTATRILSEKLFGKFPWIEWREKDKYGRILGHVYLEGRHINLEMVAEGFAWHYKKYNSDRRFANAETVAKQRKLGLWQATVHLPPWEFRHPEAALAE